MAIYIGDQKITGTGIQIDNELSDSSVKPVQNKAITQALLSIGYSDWEKPSDWIDIRSGALPNSIYLLVGHSADYTTYPQFSVQPSIANSGTYDVYVDGVKQATTASGTATTLDWQTLALTSGWDVTYPTNLRTHIVRITPSTSSDTITFFKLAVNSSTEQGLLWVHDTTNNDVNYNNAFGLDATPHYECKILKAVTSVQGYMTCRAATFKYCDSLEEIPQIKTNYSLADMFHSCKSLKRIVFLDASAFGASDFSQFYGCSALKEIKVLKGQISAFSGAFEGCSSLKSLPNIRVTGGNYTTFNNMIRGCASLGNTVFDLTDRTDLTRMSFGATSSTRIDGLKGLIVSSSAPFSSATSPQIDISYTGLGRTALVSFFNSLPTVTGSQVCNITGTTGAADLDATDLAIATSKGWTVTR